MAPLENLVNVIIRQIFKGVKAKQIRIFILFRTDDSKNSLMKEIW
jgi:hypothetical protein